MKFEVFLDISKAFDYVKRACLIFNVKRNRIFSKLLRVTMDFRSDRKQRMVLNRRWSSLMDFQVTQGSIPRPLLYFICINDLLDNLTSNPKLFTNDASLFSIVTDAML